MSKYIGYDSYINCLLFAIHYYDYHHNIQITYCQDQSNNTVNHIIIVLCIKEACVIVFGANFAFDTTDLTSWKIISVQCKTMESSKKPIKIHLKTPYHINNTQMRYYKII